jgi:methionyl-tRNA formyltransferase
LKVIFFGSDYFALEPLNALLASRHEVLGVVSRPNRPAGRGLKPVSTAVVERAAALDLELWQPENLSEGYFRSTAEEFSWDAGAVVAYGGLIPPWLLEFPRCGFVNVHPSLLPRYRGAAPVERALMNGANITGVTTMQMNERLDAGDILLHQETPISEEDTAGTLSGRLSHIGARLLVETLDAIEEKRVEPVRQDEDKATCAPPVQQDEGNIDWELPAERIDRLVRALDPAPGAFTFFRDRRLKIWAVRVTDVPPEDAPGTLMNMGKEGFLVNTGTNCIGVVTVQPEGKKRMSAAEFSRGQRLLLGERFTDRAED